MSNGRSGTKVFTQAALEVIVAIAVMALLVIAMKDGCMLLSRMAVVSSVHHLHWSRSLTHIGADRAEVITASVEVDVLMRSRMITYPWTICNPIDIIRHHL
jgi:hypothetical protein